MLDKLITWFYVVIMVGLPIMFLLDELL